MRQIAAELDIEPWLVQELLQIWISEGNLYGKSSETIDMMINEEFNESMKRPMIKNSEKTTKYITH